jgi:hypothetical protein
MADLLAFVQPVATSEAQAILVTQAIACLEGFTQAFNAADAAAVDQYLHFPHIMLSGAQRLVWDSPGQHPADFFDKLRATGWSHTRYEAQTPVLVSADKVHLVVDYTRRDGQDKPISRHVNLWIVTRIAGRWGIALRSY